MLSGVVPVDGSIDNHSIEFESFGFVNGGDNVTLLQAAATHVGLLAGAQLGDVAFQLLVQGGVEVGTYEIGLKVIYQMRPLVDRVNQFGVEQTPVGTLQLVNNASVVGIVVQLRIPFAELGHLAVVRLYE